MSSNLALMKEKLKQQKEKDQRRILEVKLQKQKVTPPPVKPKIVKNKINEETIVREAITKFLSDQFSNEFFLEENKTLKEKVIKKKWKALSDEEKLEYSMKSLIKGGTAGRAKFINEFLKIPVELRKEFLQNYIKQPRNYSTYIELWFQENKNHLAKIESKTDIIQPSAPDLPKGITYNRSKEIIDTLLQRMIEYGKQEIPNNSVLEEVQIVTPSRAVRELKHTGEKDEKSEDDVAENIRELESEETVKLKKPGYYKIIKAISSSPKKQKKIHQRIAKDYIQLAKILKIENAEELSIADLALQIAAKEKAIKLKENYDRVMNMSRDEILEKIEPDESQNIAELSDYMLKLLYIQKDLETDKKLARSSSTNSDISTLSSSTKKSKERHTVKKIETEVSQRQRFLERSLRQETEEEKSIRLKAEKKKRKKEAKKANLKEKLKGKWGKFPSKEGFNNEVIRKILAEKITARSIEICLIIITNSTGLSEEYVAVALNILKEKLKTDTNAELFEEVAKFLTYYSLPFATSFRARVTENYYIPNFLLTLSPAEMLPEIYMTEVTQETVDDVTKYVKNQIIRKVELICEKYYRLQDVTAKFKVKNENYEEAPDRIQYSENACVNKEDIENIPIENLIFYKDENNGKTYCLDSEIISKNFENQNFKNPITGELFSKKFLKKYTVVYVDPEDKKTYSFPFLTLKKQFEKGKLINEKSGKLFNNEFVTSILENSYNKPYISYLDGQFSQALTQCENFNDVIGEDIRNIVFYDDKKNKKRYCFTIQSLLENKDGINKATGEPFSSKFLEKIKKYKLPEEKVKEKQEIITNIEPVVNSLIIPDLWNLVKVSLEPVVEEKNNDGFEEVSDTDEESNNSEENSEDDSDEEIDSRESDEDLESEMSEEENNSKEDPLYYIGKISKKDSYETIIEKLSTGLEKYSQENNVKDKKNLQRVLKGWIDDNSRLEDISEDDIKKIANEVSKVKMSFEGDKENKDEKQDELKDELKDEKKDENKDEKKELKECHKCKKKLENTFFKTVLMVDDKPEIVFFCSTKCIDDEKFPTHRKVKQRKRKIA